MECDIRKANKLSDRVSRLLERTRYYCAISNSDKDAVFGLRYEAYMREGGISPNPTQRFSDPLDEASNVWIIAMEIDGELASSIRLHVASDVHAPIPAKGVFGDVIKPRLAAHRLIVDPTRHVANLAMSRRFPELPYLTIRSAWMAGEHFGADYILAAVRTEHQNFYRRVFGHQPWTEPRPYPLLTKPIICLGLDYQAQRSAVEDRYPFYKSTFAERSSLFMLSSNPAVQERRCAGEGACDLKAAS